MFQLNDETVATFSSLSPILNLVEISDEEQEQLEYTIKRQYVDLELLGYDQIADTRVANDALVEFLEFTDKNYIPIVNLDLICDNESHVQIIGRSTYSFLVVDLINDIIPRILNLNRFKTAYDLLTVDNNIFREFIFKSLSTKTDALHKLIAKVDNTKFRIELFKYSFYLDLVDNDITNLIERFLQPMISRYYVSIDAKVI